MSLLFITHFEAWDEAFDKYLSLFHWNANEN